MTIPDQDGSLFLSSSASVSEVGSFSSLAWPMLSPKAVIFPGMLSKKVLNLAVFRPISSACNLLVIDLFTKTLKFERKYHSTEKFNGKANDHILSFGA